ncbi:MAG: TetR family transcriptional regulator [Bdellovibrionota bacterium]
MSFFINTKLDVKSDIKLAARFCIIKAAANLFAKLGLDKCSTREIAKQADSNISLISYYFGGKEGLYKEVMRSYALEVTESARPILAEIQLREITSEITKKTFIEDMGKIISNIISTRLKNPELSKIFSREKLAGLPYSKEIHEEIFYPLILNFYRLIESGQQKGYVKSEINPALLFITITEGIWGFYEIMECDTSLSHDCKNLTQDPELLKNQLLNIYLMGVLK